MNIAFLILAEFLFISFIILFLFNLRNKLGLAPLYVFLGSMQYLQTVLATSFHLNITQTISLSPGSLMLFSSALFALLLVYIKEGVDHTRSLIYGIVLANISFSIFVGFINYQENTFQNIFFSSGNISNILEIDYRVFAIGTTTLLLDFYLLVIIYKLLATRSKILNLFFTIFLSLLTVLIFDALIFTTASFYMLPDFASMLTSQLLGKSIAAFLFAIALYTYIRFFDKEKKDPSYLADKSSNIFSIINYREKYESLKLEKEQVEKDLTSRLEDTLNGMTDGFISLDKNGRYLFINDAAAKLLNLDANESIGKSIWAENEKLKESPYYDHIKRVLKTQEPFSLDYHIEQAGKWTECRILPSKTGLTLFYKDITEIKQEKEQKEETERRNQALLNTIPDIMFVLDKNGFFKDYHNPKNLSTSKEPEFFIGKNIKEIYSGEIAKTIIQNIKEVLLTESILIHEYDLKLPDGTHSYEARYAKTNEEEVLMLVRDITEAKAAARLLKQSEDNYRLLLNRISDSFISLDKNWNYTYINKKAAEIIGRSPEQLIGKNIWNEFPERIDQPIYKAYHKALETQETQYLQEYYKPIDKWFESRIYPSPEGLTIFFADITSIKNAEALQQELNVELEKKVKERTSELRIQQKELQKSKETLLEVVEDLNIQSEELKIAKEKAQAADRLKSAFLATMSHELRTPLNSIIGFTGILLKEYAGSLNDEQTKQLKMVKRSGHHLLNLINDVLDISKIEAGELTINYSKFEFLALVEQVAEGLKPMADDKGIDLIMPEGNAPIKIISDKKRVEQILINLLNNGIKFTNEGYVKLDYQINKNVLEVQVIDTGIGIKQEDQKKLFTPFSQIDSGTNRNHEGTGLGLSICHKLISKLGGSIHVESEFGKGSIFKISLPVNEQ